MSTSKIQPRAESFLAALRRADKDRGKMAALRRAFSPHNHRDAWPVIADLGGDIERPQYVTIAALYAMHPQESELPNFGATCRQIAIKDSSDGKLPSSYEHRFRRLIAADSSEQLGEILRAWIRLAASKGVGVNYGQLFIDLWNWDWRTDDIRVRWAAQFWPARKAEAAPVTEEEGT
jgi:CRISPR type I-E-associated protein CasB/Cse2